MGCDIHAFVDIKITLPHYSYWQSLGELYIPRSYALFGILAGVRNTDMPRCLPADPIQWEKISRPLSVVSSRQVDYYFEDGDYHTLSRLTLKDLKDHEPAVQAFSSRNHAEYDYLATDYREFIQKLENFKQAAVLTMVCSTGPSKVEDIKDEDLALVFYFDS